MNYCVVWQRHLRSIFMLEVHHMISLCVTYVRLGSLCSFGQMSQSTSYEGHLVEKCFVPEFHLLAEDVIIAKFSSARTLLYLQRLQILESKFHGDQVREPYIELAQKISGILKR